VTRAAGQQTCSEAATFGAWDWARGRPDRPALVAGDVTTTFGELVSRANQISRALRRVGVDRQGVVAAIVGNKREFFELALATGQIGAYLLAVNWHLTPDEIKYILLDSGAHVVVADADLAVALAEEVEVTGAARIAIGRRTAGWSSYEEFGLDESTADVEDRSYGAIMGYTSGTTGRPKGVKRVLDDVSPEQGLQYLRAMLEAFGIAGPDGMHLLCSPAYHAAPSAFATGALHFGQTVVVHERFDAEAVLRSIEQYAITSSHMVPTHFHRLLRLPAKLRLQAEVSSLRTLIHAGAPCPVEIKRQMLEWLGPIVWEYLGATEGVVSIASPKDWCDKPGTVGRPLEPGAVVIKRVDGTDAGAGEEGLIYFKTNAPFEYHNSPERTAESRSGEFVTVGDIGMIDEDGALFLLDRRTDLIVSGGVNIYPAEVEAALITHPEVEDVGVIGVSDPEWGKVVLAVVHPVVGVTVDADLEDSLRAHAAANLPSFKRPRLYRYLADFPRTAAGKVRRRDLLLRYEAEVPSGAGSGRSTT
jgi:long-chain acyl-CoA synthetase